MQFARSKTAIFALLERARVVRRKCKIANRVLAGSYENTPRVSAQTAVQKSRVGVRGRVVRPILRGRFQPPFYQHRVPKLGGLFTHAARDLFEKTRPLGKTTVQYRQEFWHKPNKTPFVPKLFRSRIYEVFARQLAAHFTKVVPKLLAHPKKHTLPVTR